MVTLVGYLRTWVTYAQIKWMKLARIIKLQISNQPKNQFNMIYKTYLYQGAIDWLNSEAPLNIAYMVVTLLTFQADNDWLNSEAS